MTTLTLATVAVILFGMFGPYGYGRALAIAGSTKAGAALVVGATAVPTFYAVAIGAAIAVVHRWLGRGPKPRSERLPLPPGVALLLLFLAWSVLVTFVAPLLFDGQRILLPSGDDNARLIAGVITSSNVAQIAYLVLGIFVVVFIARAQKVGPELIGIAVGLTVLLSFWRYLNQQAGIPFPEGVFDNSPFFAYIEQGAGGVERFRGILSEPSSLAGSALIAVAYMMSRATQLQGVRRWGALTVAVIAGYLGTISTSASFVVAAVIVAGMAGFAFLVGFLLRRTSVSVIISLISCLLVVVALWVLPVVIRFVESVVNDKVSSSSFADRSGADTVSYEILVETFGIGVGLGSNRASSFLASLLGSTGVIGTVLFASVIVTLIWRSAAQVEYRPVIWALVSLLVLKVVSGPDLSDTGGIMYMSLGLLSRAALSTQAHHGRSRHRGRNGGRRAPEPVLTDVHRSPARAMSARL